MRISLIALKPLTYAGQRYEAGDYFEATPVWAAAFKYQRKARFFSKADNDPHEPDEVSIHSFPPDKLYVDGFDDIASGLEEPVVVENRQKRRYRRRDLRAEE